MGHSKHCPLCLEPIDEVRTMLINAAPGTLNGKAAYVEICRACAQRNVLPTISAVVCAAVVVFCMARLMAEADPPGGPSAFDLYLRGLVPSGPLVFVAPFAAMLVTTVLAFGLGHMR